MKRFLSTAISLIILVLIALGNTNAAYAGVDQKSKAVLVTGASTGIGRNIAELLAENGYFVYAGARKQGDLDSLNKLANVQAIKLDVTIQAQVDAAVETVRKEGRGLYGLVNNAGVFVPAALIQVDEEEMKWLFDVNVFGVSRVTQAFAPMIIEQKGRITTIGSIAGIGTGTLYGPYSMTKHAIEAYTDALAAEMKRFDVHVSIIEPGNFQSKIGDSMLRRMTEKGYMNDDSPYAEDLQRLIDNPVGRSSYKPPIEVAEAAMHFLSDTNPKRRYLVTPSQEEAEWTIRTSLKKLVQLNEQQPYSYTREEIIAMFDAVTNAEEN